MMFARTSSRRGINGGVDPLHARRFCDLVALGNRAWSYSSLLKLGTSISKRNRGLREEISFAGAPVASSASIVFAPHTRLPALMKNVEQEFVTGNRSIDPAAATAITGFYCVSMHPFLDGNGRWSRVVAAGYGMSVGDSLPVMINAMFQNVAKLELATVIWPHTRTNGLRDYVDASWHFEDVLMRQLHGEAVFDGVARLSTELRGAATGKRQHQNAMATLFSDGVISLTRLRTILGQSQHVHQSVVKRLRDLETSLFAVSGTHLSIEPLQVGIERMAMNAVKTVFNSGA